LSIRAGIIPKAVVLAVADVLQPLFRMPVIVTISSGVIAVDAWLGATQRWREGLHQISRQPGLLLAVVGFTLAAGLFHEAGHATATRYGGAEPGPIGAGIYLLWPVFYNDLNDSYRLSRRGRIRADLGGVYFNAVFILAAGAGYALTGFKALLVVIVIQHLAILQQFLPFIRLDGYYLVSDLVGVPDLFGRIRPILESLVPGRTAAAAVMELKSKVRLVVTAWVLLTIPALMAAAALFALNLPRLVNAGWTSLRIQGALLREAAQTGNVLQAMLGVLQLLVIAFPVLGVTALIIGLVRRLRPVTLQAQDVGAHDGGGEQPPVPTGGAADMAMPAGPSDEQARRICAQQNCDNDLPPRGRGRPAVYCSPACWPSRVRPSSRVTATYP
jgi:putative peptide zinc metalloprotease protein